jgi:hypothetical protein
METRHSSVRNTRSTARARSPTPQPAVPQAAAAQPSMTRTRGRPPTRSLNLPTDADSAMASTSANARALDSLLRSATNRPANGTPKRGMSTSSGNHVRESRQDDCPGGPSGNPHGDSSGSEDEDDSDSDDSEEDELEIEDEAAARSVRTVIQAPTYVAYGKPKPYTARKDEDFEIFLSRMEDYFQLSKTKKSDKLVSLLLNLDGDARKAADILQVRSMKYKKACKALKKHFGPKETASEWLLLFDSRRQHEHEPIPQFAQQLRILASKAYPTFSAQAQERLTLDRFIRNLANPQTARRLLLKQPKDLAEAVECAKLADAVFRFNPRQPRWHGNAMSVDTPNRYPNAYRKPSFNRGNGYRNRGSAFAIWNATQPPNQSGPNKPTIGSKTFEVKSPAICFNCGKPGHFRRDCRAPRRLKNATSTAENVNHVHPGNQNASFAV